MIAKFFRWGGGVYGFREFFRPRPDGHYEMFNVPLWQVYCRPFNNFPSMGMLVRVTSLLNVPRTDPLSDRQSVMFLLVTIYSERFSDALEKGLFTVVGARIEEILLEYLSSCYQTRLYLTSGLVILLLF